MNPVVHFEIPADDIERAKKFYSEIFGWKLMPTEMDYTILQTAPADKNGMPKKPGSINGGMMEREAPLSHPIITIGVPDIDEALKQIEKMGGETVREKMEVGDMGFAAYFKDSEGNTLGLWQSA